MFDMDLLLLKRKTFQFFFFLLFILIIVFFILMVIKNDVIYENSIVFIEKDRANILVDEKMLEKIHQIKEINLLNQKYAFSIEEINKKKEIYFVTIQFPYVVNLNCNTYQIKIGEENILNYFLRVIKGGE